jgi:NADH:ubiquinone oxidoreductase subunit 6 (subunit J)
VVLSTCGLFLLLAAPFLMAATIIIYAGAIVVTFLFVLMLAQQEGLSSADARSREPLLATLTGFVLMAALLYVLRLADYPKELDTLLARVQEALAAEDPSTMRKLVEPSAGDDSPEKRADDLFVQAESQLAAYGLKDMANVISQTIAWEWSFLPPDDKLEAMRKPLLKLEALLLEARERTRERVGTVEVAPGTPLSSLSGTPASTPYADVRRDAQTGVRELPADNSAYLGRALFTDFLLPVELGGTLLLVAAIGAIAIGQGRSGGRGQPPETP